MRAPYTEHYGLAVSLANVFTASALTAIARASSVRPGRALAAWVAGVWVAACVPMILFGSGRSPEAFETVSGVRVALILADHLLTTATCLRRNTPTMAKTVAAVVGASVVLFSLRAEAPELTASILVVAAGASLVWLRAGEEQPVPESQWTGSDPHCLVDDVALFVLAASLAAIVCHVVLHRFANASDEWANTFQADLFGHGLAFAPAPSCPQMFENPWVFIYDDRWFAEYTPGWPLFMAPFSRARIVWLAAPLAFGLMVTGAARLARRVAAAGAATAREPRVAGWVAGLSLCTGASILMNGASRFPHVFVGATFVWTLEVLCVLTEGRGLSVRAQWLWGLALGCSAALMTAARPVDGVLLGTAPAFYYGLCVARRQLSARAVAASLGAAAFLGGLSLVILRLQVGRWFATGYSLAGPLHGDAKWAVLHLSWPSWADLPSALPLATGSYMWWPCGAGIGVLGLASARRGARHIALLLASGTLFIFGFYVLVEYNRDAEWGYGPRYFLVGMIPMGIGGGVILGRLAAQRRARAPLVVALVAFFGGAAALAPLLYPWLHRENHRASGVERAIEREQLHNAVVLVKKGTVGTTARDLTHNYGTIAHPDVLILYENPHFASQNEHCLSTEFAERSVYIARGTEEVSLTLVRSSGDPSARRD